MPNSALHIYEPLLKYMSGDSLENVEDIVKQKSIKLNVFHMTTPGGHGGRVVTLSPPTSEAGVRSP